MRVLLTSAIVAGLLARSGTAQADDCACPGHADQVVISPIEDTAIPTNGRILLRDKVLDPRIVRNTPMGEEISTHFEPAGGEFVWLVVDNELNPASQYKITTLDPNGTDRKDLMRFNAFSGPDEEPPQVANVTPEFSLVSGQCFSVELVTLKVSGAADALGLALTVKLEIQTPKEESVLYFSDRETSFVSADQESKCFVEAPDTRQGWSYKATATVYDRAGNAAPPINMKINFPKQADDSGACAFRSPTGGSRAPAAALAIVVAGLALGRRRRPRRQRPTSWSEERS